MTKVAVMPNHKLAGAIKMSGMFQFELAKILNIREQYLSAVVNQREKRSEDLKRHLCRIIKVEYRDIFDPLLDG